MVNLVSSASGLGQEYKRILIPELEFYEKVATNTVALDDVSLGFMRAVDGAELVDATTGTVKTRYGLTALDNLSTGLKTIILTHMAVESLKPAVINISECGSNVLRIIFDLIDDTRVVGILTHSDFDFDQLLRLGCTFDGKPIEHRLQLWGVLEVK